MSNTLKFSIKDHQFADKSKRQSERSNPMNFLNLSQINRNPEKNNALNSDRTLSYRYEKINNSFRLVQVDGLNGDNKENVNEPNRRLSDGKNTRIIQSINQLCQRVEKLQKNQKFEDQKQSFNLHKLIEKAVTQSLDLKNSKYCLERQKIIQNALMEVHQVKQKIQNMSIVPGYVNEIQVLRKCKNMIEQEILGEKMERVKSMRQQIEKLHGIVGRQSQSIYNNQSAEHIRLIDTLMNHMNQKMDCGLKNIQTHLQTRQNQLFKEVDRIKSNQNSFAKNCQQLNLKTAKDRAITSSHNQTAYVKTVRQRCLKGTVAHLVIQLGLKNLNNKAINRGQYRPQQVHKFQHLTYQIDPQGLLVDSQGFYLQDQQGSTIKINEEHVKKLVQLGIFNK